jgi:hypothetical protein
VATTTYRPVVIRQAGYPTTVYQPITAFRPQISYAAYASQPVSYAPSYAYAAPAAACSTCPTTVTVPAAATMSVPSTTGTQPTLATPGVIPSTSGDPANVTPTLNPATNSPTYNPQQPSTEATPQSIQNHTPTSPSTDRTTLRPVYPAAPVRMASLTIERTGLNAGGWHAADE